MKITVVTVCFNADKLIDDTIKSVIEQNYHKLEYIIVDGDSKDKTKDKIQFYKGAITKLVSEPDLGIYDAMNKGIDLATGKYIIFMNAGDIFSDNDVLNDIFSIVANKNQPDLIVGNTINKATCLITKRKAFKPKLLKMPACHQSIFYKRSIIAKFKYDLNYKLAADFKLTMTIFNSATSILEVDRVISVITAGGISDLNRIAVFNEYKNVRLELGDNKVNLFFLYSYFNMVEKCKSIVKWLIKKFV